MPGSISFVNNQIARSNVTTAEGVSSSNGTSGVKGFTNHIEGINSQNVLEGLRKQPTGNAEAEALFQTKALGGLPPSDAQGQLNEKDSRIRDLLGIIGGAIKDDKEKASLHSIYDKINSGKMKYNKNDIEGISKLIKDYADVAINKFTDDYIGVYSNVWKELHNQQQAADFTQIFNDSICSIRAVIDDHIAGLRNVAEKPGRGSDKILSDNEHMRHLTNVITSIPKTLKNATMQENLPKSVRQEPSTHPEHLQQKPQGLPVTLNGVPVKVDGVPVSYDNAKGLNISLHNTIGDINSAVKEGPTLASPRSTYKNDLLQLAGDITQSKNMGEADKPELIKLILRMVDNNGQIPIKDYLSKVENETPPPFVNNEGAKVPESLVEERKSPVESASPEAASPEDITLGALSDQVDHTSVSGLHDARLGESDDPVNIGLSDSDVLGKNMENETDSLLLYKQSYDKVVNQLKAGVTLNKTVTPPGPPSRNGDNENSQDLPAQIRTFNPKLLRKVNKALEKPSVTSSDDSVTVKSKPMINSDSVITQPQFSSVLKEEVPSSVTLKADSDMKDHVERFVPGSFPKVGIEKTVHLSNRKLRSYINKPVVTQHFVPLNGGDTELDDFNQVLNNIRKRLNSQ